MNPIWLAKLSVLFLSFCDNLFCLRCLFLISASSIWGPNLSLRYLLVLKAEFGLAKWIINPHMPKMVLRGSKHVLTQNMPESSGSMHFSFLMLENIWYDDFTWSESNSQEIVNLLQFNSSPWGPTIGTKLTISYEFDPPQVKGSYNIFSNMQ